MSNTPRSLNGPLADKRTRKSPREYGTFERINGHELFALPHFFWYTRVPILNPDKDTLAIIVSRITDVERPARIPERWPGSSADMSSCELARDLFDDVF